MAYWAVTLLGTATLFISYITYTRRRCLDRRPVRDICNLLLKLQKPPAPVAPREQTSPVHKAARGQEASQTVTCLAQLAHPRKARESPGRDSDHHSPAVTQATPTPTPSDKKAVVFVWRVGT